ncbi:MAG: hypothetical protein ACRC7I_07215 [Selenomonadaceae bacterium]
MALTKRDEERIEHLFKRAVALGSRRAKDYDPYKRTEKALRAYPILKENIKRYELDIEDIAKEDMRRSKDFVLFLANSGSGEKVGIEEIRATKILAVRQNIVRDQKKIDEIDIALKNVEGDEYYKVIEMDYFQRMKLSDIIEHMHCDKVTIYRNKKRLINTISVSLFGADAVQ